MSDYLTYNEYQGNPEQIFYMADYNLSNLSPRSFEQLIQALCIKVLGPSTIIFGDGPDGGREATFNGPISYPSKDNSWDGYGVVQAKFKQRPENTHSDSDWVLHQLRSELNSFAAPHTNRQKPEYYIFATNVILPPPANIGAKDKAYSIIDDYKDIIPLKGFDIWDYDKLRTFLDNYEDIRRGHAGWITSGDVLSQVIDILKSPSQASNNVIADLLYISPATLNIAPVGLEKFLLLAHSVQDSLTSNSKTESQLMITRLKELQRKQHLFGTTSERDAQIWEIVYQLNVYYFNHLGISLLSQCV